MVVYSDDIGTTPTTPYVPAGLTHGSMPGMAHMDEVNPLFFLRHLEYNAMRFEHQLPEFVVLGSVRERS
jgi:hypothetical protein